MSSAIRPFLLLILDGFGIAPPGPYNAIRLAKTPHLDRLFARYPQVPLKTDGLAVGLPEGQMGNSEVGHMNIGAGRIVYQDLTRIDSELKKQDFLKHPLFQAALKPPTPMIHLIGLMSDGGVHSHVRHTIRLMGELNAQGHRFVLHAWTDGRDTPPQSAPHFFDKLSQHMGPFGQWGSIIGRYFVMDRDKRWDRTQIAFDLLTQGKGTPVPDYTAAFEAAQRQQKTDEFMPPFVLPGFQPIRPGDRVVALNFRADRMRQITQALIAPTCPEIGRKTPCMSPQSFLSLTRYGAELKNPVLFPPQNLEKTLGQVVSEAGLTQFRAAETEKYAHVTFFFNGGQESAFPGEERQLIPSPPVATYDLQPEMSAPKLTETLCQAILSRKYAFIMANFANADMVGHTGQLAPSIRAIEALDRAMGELQKALQKTGGDMILTADHGNAECLFDPQTQQPHTAHTHNPVPCLYLGRPAHARLSQGALQDIAPTVLFLMGLPIPPEMTGQVLFEQDPSDP